MRESLDCRSHAKMSARNGAAHSGPRYSVVAVAHPFSDPNYDEPSSLSLSTAELAVPACMMSIPLFLLVLHGCDGHLSTGVNCREKTSWYTSNL